MNTKHPAALAALAAVVAMVIAAVGTYDVGATPPVPERAPGNTIAPSSAGTTLLRIDAGSVVPYTDHAGNVWLPDAGFKNGSPLDRGNIPIANTSDPRIYQTERWGSRGYSLPVAPGDYIVRLHFAETYSEITGPGQRIFDVNVEGQFIHDFDIFAETGGRNIALVKTFDVTVDDGQVDIRFTASVQYTEINGIEVLPRGVQPPTLTATASPTTTPTKTSVPPPPPPASTPTRTSAPPPPPPPPAATPTSTSMPPPPPPSAVTPTVRSNAPVRAVHLPMVVIAQAPPPSCGDSEPADDMPASAPQLAPGVTCTGTVQQDAVEGDDWFYVNAPAGKLIVVDLDGMPADADYDLFLFDSGLKELASNPRVGSNAPEHIEYRVSAAGKYYIRIVAYEKSATAANTYTLRVAFQ